MTGIEELKSIATQLRRDIIRMTNGAASGHPGGSLGCADFFSALYFDVMKHNPAEFTIDGIGEDAFFLSNGHISPVWYSALARAGYFPLKELSTFRKINTRLQGHPTTHDKLPGIRISSGSLGMGLSAAIGCALSKKMNKDPHSVFVLMGDGELEEGQVWEAAIYAAAKKVDNLIAFVDYNGQQIDGSLKEVMEMGDLAAKWKAFGWKVLETDGNDMAALLETIHQAKRESNNEIPVIVLMHTIMGKGVDFMEGTHHWHGVAPNDRQAAEALAQLEETLGDY